MPNETGTIIRWFYRESFGPGVLDFDTLLYDAVTLSLGKSPMDAEAYLQRNRGRLWSELLKNLDFDVRAGRQASFDVADRYGRKLQWLPANAASLGHVKDKQFRIRQRARPFMLQLIDSLDERQYEALGCVVSELVGATNVLLTPVGNERGIDFLATLQIPGKCHVFGGIQRLFRVVGQAKKYESRVEYKEVQRLNSTIDEIKHRSPDVQKFMPSWFQAASGPIVGWLIAQRGVQSGSIAYAQHHGITVSDSIDLAEIAALSREVDCSQRPEQRAEILRIKIDAHLSRS